MSITSDRIRENGFIHALLDEAADDIDRLEKELDQARLDGWEACESCHGIVEGKHQRAEQLEARNAELTAEVERLKTVIDSNIDEGVDKIMAMSDEQISALAGFEGRNPEDQATIARKCMEVAERNVKITELRQQLAIAEEHNARLREALTASDSLLRDLPNSGGFYGLAVMEANEQALSTPASREALDKFVAEKVKELEDQVLSANNLLAVMHRDGGHHVFAVGFDQAVQDAMAIYYELTRQRDLAVSYLIRYRTEVPAGNQPHMICHLVDKFLSAIKESEV